MTILILCEGWFMIFIKGNVPSLKNGKPNGIYHSKSVTKYLRSLNIQGYSASRKTVKEYKDSNRPNLFRQQIGNYFDNIDYPIVLGMHFVRNSYRRKFDLMNAAAILHDLLTAHEYIEDDNATCIIPAFFRINNQWYSVDKENPGVWLKILDVSLFPNILMVT